MKIRGAIAPALSALTLALVLVGCEAGTGPEDALTDGVLATFRVSGEDFRVWVTEPQAIQQIFDLRDGTSSANIPNGAIHAGPGPADHNAPWTWHMDPEDIEMAESTVEVCDGRPSLVDSLLDDYLDVGRFCPWGAELVEVDDRR